MDKTWPEAAVFVECGSCGCWHPRDGAMDCRDDAQRFTPDELDEHYGAGRWEEITLDEQEADDGH